MKKKEFQQYERPVGVKNFKIIRKILKRPIRRKESAELLKGTKKTKHVKRMERYMKQETERGLQEIE